MQSIARAAMTAATAAVMAIASLNAQSPSRPAPTPPPAPTPASTPSSTRIGDGHVVLVVEGTVRALRVTTAVTKTDAWAGMPRGVQSEFQFVALDRDGKELLRLPVDLSKFETDPTKVDAPVVVTGCEVKSPRIGILLNVPALPDAARFQFVRGKDVLGAVSAVELAELLRRPR